MSASRFVDKGTYLTAYCGEIHVECARCNVAGVVVASWDDCQWEADFLCKGCGLRLSSAQHDWAGPIWLRGRRPCGYCGHKWLHPQINLAAGLPREVRESVIVTCPECKHESAVSLEKVRDPTGIRDPHFGMPLLLVNVGRHGVLWAYNAQHIHALKAYVAAELRERESGVGNGSMFSRLPVWLKLAKNREAILRRLAKLERLLPNHSIERTRPSRLRLLPRTTHVKR